jgi:NAD(P)-dependent dehydrogenase (short-subunit alcohol dehydrogenase family)
MGRPDSKVAVITGTSSGYGRTMAVRFAKEGATVVCVDITTDVGKGFEENDAYDVPTDQLIRDTGGKAAFIKCNITKQDEVENLFKEVDEKFGSLDILVNNAGIWRGGNVTDALDPLLFQESFNVNVMGTLLCSQQALKRFVTKNKGKIVTMASSASNAAYPFQAPYNVSKGAVKMLVKSIALEYGMYQINSNAICPSYGLTPMNTATLSNEKFKEMVNARTPLGRWVHPQDVASLAVFLASEESNFINGEEILLNGGESAYTVADFMKVFAV